MNHAIARRARRARQLHAAVPGREDNVPLAAQLREPGYIDRQSKSPLFGKIPKELRDLIYEFALLAYADSDHAYRSNAIYVHPGISGPRRVAVELLLTCKAVYLETYLLPITLNPMVAFFVDGNHIPPHYRRGIHNLEKLAQWQFAALHTVDLTVQQVHLEGQAISRCAQQLESGSRYESVARSTLQRHDVAPDPALTVDSKTETTSGAPDPAFSEALGALRIGGTDAPPTDLSVGRMLDKLTLRLDRTSWWTWEDPPVSGSSPFHEDDDTPQLAIDPAYGDGRVGRDGSISRARMLKEAQKRRRGEWRDWPDRSCWGAQVANFRGLKELTCVFETFAKKSEQLEVVIECAKTWIFPMGDGYELRWDGNIGSSTWTGADDYGYEGRNQWLFAPRHTDPRHDPNLGAQSESARTSTLQGVPVPDSRLFVVKTITFVRERSDRGL